MAPAIHGGSEYSDSYEQLLYEIQGYKNVLSFESFPCNAVFSSTLLTENLYCVYNHVY